MKFSTLFKLAMEIELFTFKLFQTMYYRELPVKMGGKRGKQKTDSDDKIAESALI